MHSRDEISLFLDFDGTLVDIAPDPSGVIVSDELTDLLAQCSEALNGRLALVSGRPAKQLQSLLGSRLKIVGSHGLEFLLDEVVDRPSAPPQLINALDDMQRWAENNVGVFVEEKPLGAALHYRKNPDAGAQATQFARDIAQRYGLSFQPGSMVAEVRTQGGNKGDAVRRLMALPKMAGTQPIFIGDDATDEPAFAEAIAMGGTAILVGQPRPTKAQYSLPDVSSVRRWLASEILNG